jgi:uncharacterized protein (DUF1778 family)
MNHDDNNAMERKKPIQFLVNEDERELMDKAKEVSGFASLSDFIRSKMVELSRNILGKK